MEPVQLVQMNICQSNTYRKYFSRLDFNNKQKIQQRPQVKDQESYIPVSITNISKQLGAPAQPQQQYSIQSCKVDL